MFHMNGNARKVAQGAHGLGWASIGIALTELLAPKRVEKMLGLKHSANQQGILRTLGVRELMHGISLLATPSKPTSQTSVSVWSRVAGDMLDNALLGMAAKRTRQPGMFAAVAASVLVIGALDMYYAAKSPANQVSEEEEECQDE